MTQSTFVQDALPIVVVAVVLLAGVVAVVLAFSARGTYDRIGRSELTFDREAPGSTNDPGVQEELAAVNARRAARGRPPLTLQDLGGGPDEALRAEVRAAVEARNARRVARGQPPLDVEAEIEQRLSRQDG
jgi:hypothetical protein